MYVMEQTKVDVGGPAAICVHLSRLSTLISEKVMFTNAVPTQPLTEHWVSGQNYTGASGVLVTKINNPFAEEPRD